MSRRLGTYLVKTGTVHPNFVFPCYHNLTEYLVLSSTKSLIHLSKRKYLNFTTIRNTWYSWLNFAFLLVSHKISYKNPFYWFKIGFKVFFHWHIKHLWHLRQNTKTTYLKFQSPGIELIDKYIDLFIKILRTIYQNWHITQIERRSMVKITILFYLQKISLYFLEHILTLVVLIMIYKHGLYLWISSYQFLGLIIVKICNVVDILVFITTLKR